MCYKYESYFCRSKSPEKEAGTMQIPAIAEVPERPMSMVRIKSPQELDKKGEDPKRVNSAHSGVSRMSVITKSSISKMRYDLFGSNMAVKTPDYFKRNGISKYGMWACVVKRKSNLLC